MAKILLLGEYSKLHNSLKIGLEQSGHEVVVAGTGDRFKNFEVDYSFAPTWSTQNPFVKFLNKVTIKVLHWNLETTEKGIRFYRLLPRLKGYDLVQLINSNAIETHPRWSRSLLRKLYRQNRKSALLICGDETPIVDYQLQQNMQYSVLTPYFEGQFKASKFEYVLKYTRPSYRQLYNQVAAEASVLIASDLDYAVPLNALNIPHQFIPNPVVLPAELPSIEPVKERIVIFLGINRLSAHKKGIAFFEKALIRLQKRYPQRIEVLMTENLPYREYIARYKRAHIVLDMVYAYDQGYNALEAMLQGKVVFTGAEEAFWDTYNLPKNSVCINALPDVDAIEKELIALIEHPERITKIGRAAQAFVAAQHDAVLVARRYLKAWEIDAN